MFRAVGVDAGQRARPMSCPRQAKADEEPLTSGTRTGGMMMGTNLRRAIVTGLSLAIGSALAVSAASAQQAAAQAGQPANGERLLVLLGLGVLVLVLLLGAGFMLLSLQKTTRDVVAHANDEVRKRYLELPFGVPEGTMRGYVSVLVIVLGLAVLVLQAPLGIESSEAVTGFVSAVIAFYFVTRQQQEVRGALEDTTKTLRKTTESLNTNIAGMLEARGMRSGVGARLHPAVLATIVQRATAHVLTSGDFGTFAYQPDLKLGAPATSNAMGLDAANLKFFILAVERAIKEDPEAASAVARVHLRDLYASADQLLSGSIAAFVETVAHHISSTLTD